MGINGKLNERIEVSALWSKWAHHANRLKETLIFVWILFAPYSLI